MSTSQIIQKILSPFSIQSCSLISPFGTTVNSFIGSHYHRSKRKDKDKSKKSGPQEEQMPYTEPQPD